MIPKDLLCPKILRIMARKPPNTNTTSQSYTKNAATSKKCTVGANALRRSSRVCVATYDGRLAVLRRRGAQMDGTSQERTAARRQPGAIGQHKFHPLPHSLQTATCNTLGRSSPAQAQPPLSSGSLFCLRFNVAPLLLQELLLLL